MAGGADAASRAAFDQHDAAVLALVGAPPPDLPALSLMTGDAPGGLAVQAFGPTPDRTTPGHVRGVLLGAVDHGRLATDARGAMGVRAA